MIRTKQLLTSALALGLSAGLASGAIIYTVDFEDGGDLSDFRGTPTGWTVEDDVLRVTSTELTGTYLTGNAFSFGSDGRTITLRAEIDFPMSNTSFFGFDTLRLGITNATSGSSLTGEGGSLYRESSSNRNHRVRAYNAGSSQSERRNLSSSSLRRLEVDFTRIDSETLSITTRFLQPDDVNNPTEWSLVSDLEVTRESSVAADFFDEPFYAGLFAQDTFGDNNQFDIYNFTVIPEPRAYAALFGLLALGLVVWVRRRKA